MCGGDASQRRSVGVIIVNWNGWQDTFDAYQSLEASDFTNWTLIIIDNASTDDSIAQISRLIPSCTLIRSSINTGFAGGCNLGITRSIALGLDYVFLLNSDATLNHDALGALVSASRELGDRAALGSVVRDSSTGDLQFFGSRKSAGRGRPEWYVWPADAKLLDQEMIATDLVFGAAFFAPCRLFEEIGAFDERFFLNYEETDWCYRAALLGIPLYIIRRSVVHHQVSTSLGALDGPLQMYFMHRNRLLFYDRHGALRHRLRGYLEVVRYLVFRLGKGFGKSADPSTKILIWAIRDYLLRRFGDCPPAVRELARRDRQG